MSSSDAALRLELLLLPVVAQPTKAGTPRKQQASSSAESGDARVLVGGCGLVVMVFSLF